MKEEIKPMERLTREPIAFAPGAALFGPDAGRDALPEGRGDRQEALPDARRGKGQRRAPR